MLGEDLSNIMYLIRIRIGTGDSTGPGAILEPTLSVACPVESYLTHERVIEYHPGIRTHGPLSPVLYGPSIPSATIDTWTEHFLYFRWVTGIR